MARLTCTLIAAAAVLGFTMAANAQGDDKAPGKGKGKGGDRVEHLFKKLDTNSDGKLSKDEFAKIGENAKGKGGNDGKGKGRLNGDVVFGKLDSNSDSYLSLDEFRKLSELRKNKKDK